MTEPADVIRNAAGQMIHTKIYKKECEAAFPELMSNYDLGYLPNPDEAIQWINSGRGDFGYGRPEHLRGFVDPQLLQPQNKVPHECMGIVGTVHKVLDNHGVESRNRFLHTQIRDDSPLYVGHWDIEADGALWDPSIPHRECRPYDNRLSSVHVYDHASDRDVFYRMRDFSKMREVNHHAPEEEVMRALAMKTLAYDAWSMANGAIMVGRQRLVCKGVPIGSTMDVNEQSRLLQEYGREFRDVVEEDNTQKIRGLLQKYDVRLVPRD